MNKKSKSASLYSSDLTIREINFSELEETYSEGYIPVSSFSASEFEDNLSGSNSIFYNEVMAYVLKKYGQDTVDLLYLITLKGHSLVSASEILNINSWTASNKIKKLSKDFVIRKYFGKNETKRIQ